MQLGQLVEHLHSALDHVIQECQLADQVGQLWIREWRCDKKPESNNVTATEQAEQSGGILPSQFFFLEGWHFFELVNKIEKKLLGGTK